MESETRRPTQATRYRQRCSREAGSQKTKKLYEMEKHFESQRNWFEKISSLSMEKDIQKLWQLTKAFNDDKVCRGQTVLLTESGPAPGKAACNILANAYKNVSEVEISRSRIHDIQRETKELKNIDVPSHRWIG
ncbi:hypothetical protein RRG08_014413 [Elysia crispata]|uniref:Uncharacterized protein n=1 Tax=Elysia crispata TaxID=231223 RepID=A0AAE0YX62_9GAST|nr:hypothetical protein RRG08_014413 [Elysia crispata]